MKNLIAYYGNKDDPTPGPYVIHRVIEEGTFRGWEAIAEKGFSISCPDDVQVGWYYDEENKKFLTPEEFKQYDEEWQHQLNSGISISD